MNILHVIPGDLWAGAESQVYYLLKTLHKISQHNIAVVLFCKGELYQRLLSCDVPVIMLNEKSLGNIKICYEINRQLRERKVDIVHVHEYKSHILTAFANKMMSGKNRSVLFRTMHGKNTPNSIKSSVIIGVQNFFLKYMTDHLITVSGELKETFLLNSPRVNVHLLYNAVEQMKVISRSEISTIRKSFMVPEDQFWIGTAARLEDVKNIKMLIDSANIFQKKYPGIDIRVSVFGEGSLREVLQEQIIHYGLTRKVFLEGQQNNILPVLGSLDVFTLSSWHEGLPMSLLEAMSVGTVAVCTAVGGIKEVITHGTDGFLVTSGNAEELADTLVQLAMDNGTVRQAVRTHALDTINRKFSIEENANKLLSLYESASLRLQ